MKDKKYLQCTTIARKMKKMHIVTTAQFIPKELEKLFQQADEFRHRDTFSLASRQKLVERHAGRQLCSLFYEPSTRTRLSFETAAIKMGMGLVSTENAREFSSAAKGETLEDTIRTLNAYHYDVIAMRHHETGAAERAAAVSSAPILNAGDGKGEHPTQALLDTYTIYNWHKKLDNLTIVLGGDLANGRTVRSLAQLLAQYSGNSFVFVSPPELQMKDDIKAVLKSKGCAFTETTDVKAAMKNADVVYWTRLQKERLENPDSINLDDFQLNPTTIASLPQQAIIMHPLPRVSEIAVELDADPRAQYFQQAGNGLYIRMALIDALLQ
jgi:aspartate carbamoyltransferase catalytic subunit